MITSSENIPGTRYRVGIDVGLKSIGFCAVEVDRSDQPVRLLNSMVFIHDAGVDPNENKAYRSGCVGFWAVFRCYKAERWGLDSL